MHLLVRCFWTSVLLSVITLAVVVQLGRALFPLLDDYRPVLEEQLSQQLGAEVTLGRIEARWRGLRPRVTLHNVAVQGLEGKTIFTAERTRLEIALLATLRDWRLAIRQFHFHALHSTLVQGEDGNWRVQGLPESAPREDAYSFEDPLDIFLFGRRIELTDTRLQLQLRNGVHTLAEMPSMTLENDAQFHRLLASFTLGEAHQFMHLVVEGHGDPRNADTFEAAGHLQLNGFPLPKLLAALDVVDAPALAAELDAQSGRAAGELDTQLWFEGTPQRGLTFRGHFTTYGLPVETAENVRAPERLAARLHGHWQRDGDWHLALNDLEVRWQGEPGHRLNAQISGGLDKPAILAVEQLDVANWHQLLQQSGLLPNALSEVLAELEPYGTVQYAHLQWVEPEQGHVQVRAQLRDAGVHAWQGAPALGGVDGYLYADARGGQLLLAREGGFTMEFPGIYHEPLQFEEAFGGLRWHIDLERGTVGVSSSPLRVTSQGVQATALLNLRLPFGDRSPDEPEMTLVIGAPQSPALRHRELVPVILPDALYDWLGQSIQGGQLSDVAFIYHGTLLPQSQLSRSVQLSAQVDQVELAFSEDWPALTEARGRLLLDNQHFSVTEVQGRLMDVPIREASVQLIENPQDDGLALAIRGQSKADSGAAMDFLQNSPIGPLMGEELASWDLAGGAQGEVDLLIPLKAEARGARQQVSVQLTDNRLTIPRLRLDFQQINGAIEYSNTSGFRAPGLRARLWQQNVDLDIHTVQSGEQAQLQVGFVGNLDFAQLPEWLNHSHWTPLLSGVSPVTGQLQVPLQGGDGQPILFRANSPLQGVALQLPEPLAKTEEEVWPVELTATISPDTDLASGLEHYRIQLADRANVQMAMQRGQLQGLTLSFGRRPEAIEPGVINIQGALESVHWHPWRSALAQLFPLADPTSSTAVDPALALTPAGPTLPVRVALAVRALHTDALTLEHLSLVGERTESTWQLALENPNLSGTLAIHGGGQPMEVALDYLHLPGLDHLNASANGSENGEPGPAMEFDALEPLNASIGQLKVGEEDFGKWAFKARPVNDGLAIYDIHGQVRGLTIAGQERGAELFWLSSGGQQHSYFSGVVSARDIGQVLSHWQTPPALTSRRARFDLELQWPGAPHQLTLVDLAGLVDLNLERGRFLRGAEVGENPLLKLIGLFNFDTLARRLRLDFSDLNPEGMAYERVAGSLLFQRGNVHISKPIQMDSPSSNIQVMGDIDLKQQEIDAHLVATLPLAGNLTVAAALTGGLPIAVGVYVAGKIFQRQVDRASSLRYHVHGPWNDPEVKLQKIFDNPSNTSNKNSSP